MIAENPAYFVEVKVASSNWFWSLIYRGTTVAVGKKGYTTKNSAKRAFENMFEVKLVTRQYFGKGIYRETYNIFGVNRDRRVIQ